MIEIFNGRSRGVDGSNDSAVFVRLQVAFREHLHRFKGARLHVFLDIALHADADGFCHPSFKRIEQHTGYKAKAITQALEDLCSTSIDGELPVLVRWRETNERGKNVGSNRYRIFPENKDIEDYYPEWFEYWQKESTGTGKKKASEYWQKESTGTGKKKAEVYPINNNHLELDPDTKEEDADNPLPSSESITATVNVAASQASPHSFSDSSVDLNGSSADINPDTESNIKSLYSDTASAPQQFDDLSAHQRQFQQELVSKKAGAPSLVLKVRDKNGKKLSDHQLKVKMAAFVMFGGDLNERYDQISEKDKRLVRTLVKELNKDDYTVQEYMEFYREIWQTSWEYKNAVKNGGRSGMNPNYNWIKRNIPLVRASQEAEQCFWSERPTSYDFECMTEPISSDAERAARQLGATHMQRHDGRLWPADLGHYDIIKPVGDGYQRNYMVNGKDGYRLFSTKWHDYSGPTLNVDLYADDSEESDQPSDEHGLAEMWPDVLEKLRNSTPAATFETQIKALAIGQCGGSDVTLLAPTAYHAKMVKNTLRGKIGKAYSSVAGLNVSVDCGVQEMQCESAVL